MPHARRAHPLRDRRGPALPAGRLLTSDPGPAPAAGWSAVLLDRDGTINVKAPEGAYVTTPDELVLLHGAAAAVVRLNDAGLPVFVVTNQRGVARGLMSTSDLAAVHTRLDALLAEAGAHVDGYYACVHAGDACDCRKPLPGLVHQVLADHPSLQPSGLVLVGDAESDVGAGRAAGTRTVRLGVPGTVTAADRLAPDLASAVDLLLDGSLAPA